MGVRGLVGGARRRAHRPRVSVVVLCRAGGLVLEGAIRSVLNQSLRDTEVLAVVGQDSEAGRTIAPLADRDRRVRVIDDDDIQAAVSRSRGRLLTVIDGCDALLVGALETKVGCLEDSGASVVVGRCRPAPGDW